MKYIITLSLLFSVLVISLKSQTNIAANKTVVGTNGYYPQNALDGNTSTYMSVNSNGTYFIVDLANIYSFTNITVRFSTKYPPRFQILSSLNNVNFSQICQVNGSAGSIVITSFTKPNNINQHRYVKFIFDQYVAPAILAELLELEITGTMCYTMAYNYDAGGNRLSRTIYLNEATGLKSAKIADSTANIFTDKLEKSEIRIYPNPTKSELNVDITNIKLTNAKIAIYDINGRIVFSINSIENKTILNLSKQKPGTYFLKISNAKSSSEWTIIKE